MVTITFYDLTVDPRTCDKTGANMLSPMAIDSGGHSSLSGYFKNGADVVNPVVRCAMDGKYVQDFNYVKIEWPTSGSYVKTRWYFVRGRNVVRTGLVEIALHEDVLYTWWASIKLATGYIARSESSLCNNYLVDPLRVFSAQDNHSIEFGSVSATSHPFNPTNNSGTSLNYILTLATDQTASGQSVYTSDDWIVYPGASSTGKGYGQASYVMSGSKLEGFFQHLYSNTSVKDFIDKAIYGVGTDGIISLYAYPCVMDDSAYTSTNEQQIELFGIGLTTTAKKLTPNAYKIVDFGTFTHTPPNDFTQYEPYTSAELYLPYYGFVDIPVEFLYGAGISVKYMIDVVDGSSVIYVQDVFSSRYIKVVTCNIGEKVPITSSNAVQQSRNMLSAGLNILTGSVSAVGGNMNSVASISNSLFSLAMNPLTMSGSQFSPNLYKMMKYDPFVFITSKRDETPANFAHYHGKPMNEVRALSALIGSGYNEISDIFLNIPYMDYTEYEEIRSLLASGVIL